jgi:hypothetical protein
MNGLAKKTAQDRIDVFAQMLNILFKINPEMIEEYKDVNEMRVAMDMLAFPELERVKAALSSNEKASPRLTTCEAPMDLSRVPLVRRNYR